MDLINSLVGMVIFVITYISCALFYRKSNLIRWINKKVRRKVFTVFIGFLLYLITMSFIRRIGISGNYYDVIQPFFMAFYVSVIPALFIDKYSN
jgi:ABC-type uncharacterized transport system permease subunit